MGPSFIDPSVIDPPSYPSSTPHPIPPHGGGGERYCTLGSALHRPTPAFSSPAVSLQPMARFRFWIAWPAAPFTRLSRAEKTTTRPDAPAWTEIRQSFVPTTSESRGGAPSTTRTKGEPS